MESLTDEYDFSHDFLKPKMQQKTNTTPPHPHPKSLQRNCLWHLVWSSLPRPPPSNSHQSPSTLALSPNFVDWIAELFIKQRAIKTASLYYSVNSCDFLPPPGQRPLVRESLRKGKKKKKQISESKETIADRGFDNASPQPSFCSCCDTPIQEQGRLPSDAWTMD